MRDHLIKMNKARKGTRKTRYGALFGAVRKCYRKRADFLLSDDEFFTLIKGNCYYCDSIPSNKMQDTQKSHQDVFEYNGLDRVDNSVGYITTNVVTCCKRCNIAKNDMTHDDFISLCLRIAKRFT